MIGKHQSKRAPDGRVLACTKSIRKAQVSGHAPKEKSTDGPKLASTKNTGQSGWVGACQNKRLPGRSGLAHAESTGWTCTKQKSPGGPSLAHNENTRQA